MNRRNAGLGLVALLAVAIGWLLFRADGSGDVTTDDASPGRAAGAAGTRRPPRAARPADDGVQADPAAASGTGTVATGDATGGGPATTGRDAVRAWAGRVLDLRGNAVAGATVSVLPHERAPAISTRTAEDGSFRVPGLRAVWSRFSVEADGFAPWLWKGWPGREDVAVRLARLVTVRGVVVHADGTPAAGAEVNYDVTADDAGQFETTVPEGRGEGLYAAWGRSPGDLGDDAESGHAWIDADPAAPVTGVRVVLETVWTWVGLTVTSDDGRPLEGAAVWVRWPNGKWSGKNAGPSGLAASVVPARAGTLVEWIVEGPRDWAVAKGTTVTHATAGAPDVVVLRRAEGAAAATAPEPPAPAPVLPPTATVTVHLIESSAAARSPRTFVFDSRSRKWQSDWEGVADGSALRFTVHAPSRVIAEIGDERAAWVGSVSVVPGDDVRLECASLLPLRRFRGRVTGPGGEPLAGVPVDAALSARFMDRWDADTCTDVAGRFEVLAPDSELVWISVRQEGLARGFVRAGAGSDEIPVRLAPGGSVEVRPAAGDWIGQEAIVTAADATSAQSGPDAGPRPEWKAVGAAGLPDGGTRFDDLPPGRWRLRIEVSRRECHVLAEVRVGETTVVSAPATPRPWR